MVTDEEGMGEMADESMKHKKWVSIGEILNMVVDGITFHVDKGAKLYMEDASELVWDPGPIPPGRRGLKRWLKWRKDWKKREKGQK